MLESLNRWFYWTFALATALAGAALVLWLHQVRPGQDVIRLDQAALITSASASIPRHGNRLSIRLPDDWRNRTSAEPAAWYLLELDLEVAPNRLWSIYLPALEMTPAVFVNGTFIGGDPHPAQPLDRYWNRPVLYSIPNGLLGPGRNEIAIRLEANGAWGRLTEVYLAPEESLRGAYELRYFWRVTFLNVTTVGSLMLALFMAALSIARRDAIYAWFSAFTFAWYLQNVFFLTVQVPYDNHLWDFTAYVIIGFGLVTYAMFTFQYLGERHRSWERLLKSIAIAGPCVLLPLLLVSEVTFNLIGSVIWIGLLLALAIYPAFCIFRKLLREQNVELFFLTVCFTLTLILGLHDWLVTSGLGYRHNGMLMQFAAAPTLATFGAILMKRFIAALQETEALNRELERRVEEKAQQIESTYQRTRELEAAQLLSRERERIMRDMHDGVGSQLIGMMGHLDRRSDRDARLAADLDTALSDLRLMIDSLDDVEGDVVVALGLFRNRIQPQLDAAGLQLDWRIDDLPPVPNLGPERVLHFMRILQEAITNTIKHAGATRILVQTASPVLMNGQSCAAVLIEDDGRGSEADPSAGNRGLANMRHRAREAGLAFQMHSGPGGTRIQIGFPLANEV